MEVITEQAKQAFESLVNNMTRACQQLLNTQRLKYEERLAALEKELFELRSYKDVSLVNKLTVQVDQLQNENFQLKKSLKGGTSQQVAGSLSAYSTIIAPAREHSSKASPSIHRKDESELGPANSPESEKQPEHSVEEESDIELFLLEHLDSGKYFWDQASGNLYAMVSEDQAGDAVGKLKTIKVRDDYYYQDTIDNSVYERKSSGDVGDKKGKIVKGKFIKN